MSRPTFKTKAEFFAWYSGIYLKSPHWARVRADLFARRGRKCEWCGETNGPIQVHHKTYVNLMKEVPEDLEVLCERCHTAHHANQDYYRQKTTPRLARTFARSVVLD